MSNRYLERGVSAIKEDVHNAIKNENKGLFELISKDKLIMSKISKSKLNSIFNYSSHFKNVNLIFKRVFK